MLPLREDGSGTRLQRGGDSSGGLLQRLLQQFHINADQRVDHALGLCSEKACAKPCARLPRSTTAMVIRIQYSCAAQGRARLTPQPSAMASVERIAWRSGGGSQCHSDRRAPRPISCG
jgi:hypothetical protein